jgi:ankyrin repeat protein
MTSTSADLFAAIEADDVDRVRTLLESEPGLAGARDGEGVSALMRARYRSRGPLSEVVRARIEDLDVFEAAAFGETRRLRDVLDSDPALSSARSGDGFTALHFAAFFGTPEVVELLLGRGAAANAAGAGWMTGTALHSAVSANRIAIARILLHAGADPDARQAEGFTPLHSAAHNGAAALVRLLLERGADPRLATDDGRDALSFARGSGDTKTVRAIEEWLARER